MCSMTLRMSPIVWCSLSIIASDCGFFTIVGTIWIPSYLSRSWNSQSMNSPPLSCTTLVCQGCLDSQQFENCCATWALDLSLILMISSELVTGSIAVRVLNTTSLPWIVIFQGPIRSTTHSVHDASRACLGARYPYGLPWFLYLLQLSGQRYCWYRVDGSGW